jgi:hypothetical protein
LLTSDQIIEKLEVTLQKANAADKAKLLSIAISASKGKHERILTIAKNHFFGANLND